MKNLIKKWVLGFRYPKLAGFAIAIVFAYYLFSNPVVENAISGLGNWGYLGVFIAGTLFSFGFTSPFAAGFFIVLNPSNILASAMLGGFGAMIADLVIFQFIRFSFAGEFKRLKKERLIRKIEDFISFSIGKKLNRYLIYLLAGIIIASPLPDELGVAILAGLTNMKSQTLAIIGFIFNSLGILVLLLL